MKKILIATLVFFAGMIATNFCHASGYSYYRAITVTSTTSVASGTNANFPMLVSSTVSSFEPVSDGGRIQNLCTAATDGGQEPCDLVFTTSTACTSPLNFETEKYVSSTGEIDDWVNVPTMQAGSVIYACYGNSSVNTDQSHPSGTWNSSYVAVYHFPNGNGSLGLKDSTANALNGTATSTPSSTVGAIDGGISVDGTNFYTASSSVLGLGGNPRTASGTVEMWGKSPTLGNDTWVINGYNLDGNSNGYGLSSYYYGTGSPFYKISAYGAYFFGYFPHDTNWHMYSLVFPVLGGDYGYTDGVATNTNMTDLYGGTTYTGAIDMLTGKGAFNADELRVLNTALSASWVQTEYSNESSPSTFYAVGSETPLIPPSSTLPTSDVTFF